MVTWMWEWVVGWVGQCTGQWNVAESYIDDRYLT